MNRIDPQPQPSGILLVDDEQNILSALRRSLRRAPWKIYTASSGPEGLDVMRREEVQVVISDYLMRGMDGIEFLNRVKAQWPDVQRVMLTGHADFAAIERAINESEVYRFINKPWHDSQLMATVHECLDRLALVQSNRRFERELAARNRELVEVNRDLEHKVQERTRALIQAEKMAALGRMSGGVAHEINNPLGGILAFVQVLQRDGARLDPQAREGLDTIHSCALRCKRIVDNLLSFSRKPAGEMTGRVELHEVIEQALGIVRLHPRAKQVSVQLDLTEGLPPVCGNAGLLEQVLVNLLQNAFQASADGQEVVLRTRAEDGHVLIEVEDRGVGIPRDALPRVFEPFFTTKPTGEGTGLGLFVCYGIAREHGGDLYVTSREGAGATFTLQLPVEGAAIEGPGTKEGDDDGQRDQG